jgi:hypothetical protein
MKTEFGTTLLVEAFPLSLREEALVAANIAVQLMTASQWTEQFSLLVSGEQVLLPSRLRFATDDDSVQPGSNIWLMVRCLQSRSNDGFQRQRATRDLLTDLRPWTAPFVLTLIGEYIAEILIDIDAGLTPASAGLLADVAAANPAFWETTKRRVQSYFSVYHRGQYSRADYAGFRLIERLDAQPVK